MNNPTFGPCCEAVIGRADIEESKSNVAMNAWLPQASYPCGNFSDTSRESCLHTKGSIGHAFTVCIHTENQNQRSFYPFVLHEISVLIELLLGHLRYHFTDVPPQPNSPPVYVFRVDPATSRARTVQGKKQSNRNRPVQLNGISKPTSGAVVFHRRLAPPTYATSPE